MRSNAIQSFIFTLLYEQYCESERKYFSLHKTTDAQWGKQKNTDIRTDLEGDLCGEDEFVDLKETSGGVDEDWIRDAIDQVHHTLFDLFRWLCLSNGFTEHGIESLQGTMGICDSLIQ